MKKILSVFLAITILMTTFMSTTAFAVTETEKETKIYFEVPELWGTPESVYCHIYSIYGGKEIQSFMWQSNSTKCELVDAESKLYCFDTSKYCLETDTSGFAIEDNADYGLLFSAVNTEGRSYETCNLTLGSACMGDTVYVTGAELSGQDDATYNYIAEWKNNSDKYGEKAYISSVGEVTGKYFPVYQPAEEIVAYWLGSWAVLNEELITTETVKNICTTTGADPQGVYDTYAQMYADELADIENNPTIASLERVGVLVGLENPVYVVAGTENLCGVNWNGDPTQVPYNVMTKVGDIYRKTFKNVQPTERVEFKIVEWDYGKGIDWIGDILDKSFTFAVLDKCDVTITYNPETEVVDFYGDYVQLVTQPFLSKITVAGNGNGNWLNGAEWDVSNESNIMTELEDYLYEITFEDVEAGENYQFKFTADGSWADNWGGTFESFGTETNAVYNGGDNILFSLTEKSDVTITLDLREFNFATKQGAKFKITATPIEPTYVLTVYLGGTLWLPPPEYTMEKCDGVYQYTFIDCEPLVAGSAQVYEKVDNQIVTFCGSIEFDITDKSDITVTYDPSTSEVSVSGEHVKLHTIPIENAEVYLYGNGEGNWLYGCSWIFLDDRNIMTEIESGLYQIEYKSLEKSEGYEFRFKVGEDTNDDFAGVYKWMNIESDAVLYNTQNITFAVPLDQSDVTITFDLRNFDNTTKEGAKFKIDIKAMGDVNKDGVINVIDATQIMKYSAELVDDTEINLDYADVNEDGVVNILDATEIQKYLANLITSLN